MNNFNIKVGDKVYYPRGSNKILTTKDNSCNAYPLVVKGGIRTNTFATNGKQFSDDSNPSVFPATQEWYEKLVQVYPDLEAPTKRKEAREIILAMLEAGHECVLCLVGGDSLRGVQSRVYPKKDAIYGFHPNGYFYGCFDTWEEAVPITTKGQIIVDFVDGEIVLEN